MDVDMKKIILPVLITIALSLCISSCASSTAGTQLYSPVNYTQEDAVKDEVKTIHSILEKEPVKALWRSCLLMENSRDMSGVKECHDECVAKVKS